MSKQKVEVIIDVHEPTDISETVASHTDVESISIDDLPAADLEIAGVGFERKTVKDYISSLKEDRLDRQLHKLGQRYEHAYVLIDGDASETNDPFRSDIAESSIRGSWASLTAREDSGVHSVIPCSNSALLADMAIRLARKHIEESGRQFIPTESAEPDAPTALKMYLQINGVGPSMAETIYEQYPTVQEFMDEADYEALQELEGIGEQMALRIIDAFV